MNMSFYQDLSFHDLSKSSLPVSTNHVLLHPTYRPEGGSSEHTEYCGNDLPCKGEDTYYTELAEEFHPLVNLVEVVLGLDEVYIALVGVMRSWVRFGNELENRGEGNRGAVEWNGPDTEYLVHCDIEAEGLVIVGYKHERISHHSYNATEQWRLLSWAKVALLLPTLSIVISIRGLIILYQR